MTQFENNVFQFLLVTTPAILILTLVLWQLLSWLRELRVKTALDIKRERTRLTDQPD